MGDRVDELVARQLGHEPPLPGEPIDWAEVDAEAQREWREAKAAVLLRSLDPMYHEAAPHHDMSRRWLDAYRAGRYVNLGIFGATGVGKTWEAAGIARELLASMVPALMTSVPAMLQRLHPAHGDPLNIGQYQAAPVLILDDLGAELPLKDWMAEALYRISDFRSRKLLPTIVTSNLGDPALEAAYNDRLLRRLFQGAARLVITTLPAGAAPLRFGGRL
jgi:hypothetical protein